MRIHALVFTAFTLLAAWWTHPLLRDRAVQIGSDPGDPILNTSILWWNATVLPLSAAWWNQPYFYPTVGVTAFTEHLLGVSVIATPIYWATRDPIATYNLALFLSWPLSAFTAYLLVYFLTRRTDAALLAGLAWGFTPYRIGNVGHLQTLSSYFLPLVLLGLHGYVRDRRPAWLLLFAVAWLAQALANNYFFVFMLVLIPLWVAYFCSAPASWRAAPAIAAAWIAGSLPLVPIALGYLEVHEHYGLRRALNEWRGFSIGPANWARAAGPSWAGPLLGSAEQSLFPGVIAVALVLVAAAVWLADHRGEGSRARAVRVLRGASVTVLAAGAIATLVMLVHGPLQSSVGGIELRMTSFTRVLWWFAIGAIGWLACTPAARALLARRSPFVFYLLATVVFAVLACGPLILVRGEPILEPAPWAWLMQLPGFDRLRVPARIWMLGTLCLSAAAGLGFASVARRHARIGVAIGAIGIVGLTAEGWVREFPMSPIPEHWPRVERRDQTTPILELPLGPGWDAAATFRSIRHRRPVVNGVSGYDPPFYAPLQAGLEAGDTEVVEALASLGPLDVIVDGREDRDGRWARYAASVPGAAMTQGDGIRTVYHVAKTKSFDETLGAPVPIAAVSVSGDPERAAAAIDARIDTQWENGPQRPGQWIAVDLGTVHEVAGVTHALGEFARDFPRQLAIDVSLDGAVWEEVLVRKTAALALLSAIDKPIAAEMRFRFAPRQARYVRLRQTANHRNLWRVSELRVHVR